MNASDPLSQLLSRAKHMHTRIETVLCHALRACGWLATVACQFARDLAGREQTGLDQPQVKA